MEKTWGIRLIILLGVPAIIAGMHAFSRPLSLKDPSKKSQLKEQRPTGEEGSSHTSGEEQKSSSEEPSGIDAQLQQAYDDWLMGDGVAFVDARPIEYYEQGHIPGAFSLPFSDFMTGTPAAVDLLPLDQKVYIYCDGGDCDSSHKVSRQLELYGYTDLEVLEAGFPAWRDAGFEVEEGPPMF